MAEPEHDEGVFGDLAMTGAAGRLDRAIQLILASLVAAALAIMAVIAFVDVVGRNFLAAPIQGSVEMVRLLLLVITFVGLPLVTRRGGHIAIDLLDAAIPRRARRPQRSVLEAMAAILLGIGAWQVWFQAQQSASAGDTIPFLGIDRAPVIYGMSVLMAIATLMCLVNILAVWRHDRAGSGAGYPPSSEP
jgi:TRAP-type C4-dicarboxylate transport system permease small subunit